MDYMELPNDVQAVVDSFGNEQQLSYLECRRLVEALNKIGWTCDYDLAGIPFDFVRLQSEEDVLYARIKARFQLQRYMRAATTKQTITISNMDRFDEGFRDRLAKFFENEIRQIKLV